MVLLVAKKNIENSDYEKKQPFLTMQFMYYESALTKVPNESDAQETKNMFLVSWASDGKVSATYLI